MAIGVKTGLQQAYIEGLQKIILPAYERANSELFKQLYEAFNKGTIACKYKWNNFYFLLKRFLIFFYCI